MPSVLAIALYSGVLGIAYIYRYTFVLTPLFYNEAHTVLQFPLPEFTGLKYWTLYIYFITRSLLRRLPFLAQKKLSPTQKDEDSYTVPGIPISLEIPFRTSASDLIRYNRAAKTSGIDTLSHPLHLMLFLSGVTEPAMLLLLTKINCPMDPIGGVNVRNRFEIIDPQLLDSKLKEVMASQEEMVQEQGWKVKTRLDPNLRKVKRGWEVTIVVELVLGNDILFRQFFTFLQFAKHSPPASSDINHPDPDIIPSTSVSFSSNDPYLWATLSKDYNPIHFSSTLARLFGFKSMIAHGNHVLAKGLAKLDIDGKGMEFMEVEFRRPVFIPSELDVGVDKGERSVVLGIKGKASVVARYGQWYVLVTRPLAE
jgi:acyl dehydratase